MTYGVAQAWIQGPQPRWRIANDTPGWVELQVHRDGRLTIDAAFGPHHIGDTDQLRDLARALHLAADILDQP